MATYVVLFNWTEQGIKSYKDSTDRAEAARKQWSEAGIELKDIYWTIGPYDLVGVIEAPGDEVLASALLQLGAQGNVRTTTLRAFSSDEFSRLT
jgi:uncharacterized protein with GYD domain